MEHEQEKEQNQFPCNQSTRIEGQGICPCAPTIGSLESAPRGQDEMRSSGGVAASQPVSQLSSFV